MIRSTQAYIRRGYGDIGCGVDTKAIVSLLDRILLAVMIVELLYTVQLLRGRTAQGHVEKS